MSANDLRWEAKWQCVVLGIIIVFVPLGALAAVFVHKAFWAGVASGVLCGALTMWRLVRLFKEIDTRRP